MPGGSQCLDAAQDLVNIVRNRAANPAGFVHTYIDNSKPQGGFTTTPAANYFIKPYAAGFFAGLGQAGARKYVHFERRLELGMEGQRFFDLVRYGQAEATAELNCLCCKRSRLWISTSARSCIRSEWYAICNSSTGN